MSPPAAHRVARWGTCGFCRFADTADKFRQTRTKVLQRGAAMSVVHEPGEVTSSPLDDRRTAATVLRRTQPADREPVVALRSERETWRLVMWLHEIGALGNVSV